MRLPTKILTILTLLLAILSTMVGCANIARDIPRGEKFDSTGYEITFLDDFDGDRLDTTRWRYFTGERSGKPTDGHHHRGGYYSSDMVSVGGGNLTISTRYMDKGKYGTGWYSAWIESTTYASNRAYEPAPDDYVGFGQKYGYFEVRCICPPAEGMWSAFWLMPNEGKAFTKDDVLGTGRDGTEIDIMESQNYFRKKPYVQHVAHCDYGTGDITLLKSDKSPIYKVPNMYSEFHTYGVEWTQSTLTFYIDGYKTYSTPFKYNGKELGVPQIEESMLLSVEVAGYTDKDGNAVAGYEKDGSASWLGNIDNMDKSKSYDFVVDYVKVMQKK